MNRRSNQTAQKRISGIGLKVPGVFQEQKQDLICLTSIGVEHVKSATFLKKRILTAIWKRTSGPRGMLVIAVTLNQ